MMTAFLFGFAEIQRQLQIAVCSVRLGTLDLRNLPRHGFLAEYIQHAEARILLIRLAVQGMLAFEIELARLRILALR